MLISMTGVYLPPFYAGKMGVTLTVIGRLSGCCGSPTLGSTSRWSWLMDNTRTPIGRYRPWYLKWPACRCSGSRSTRCSSLPMEPTTGYLFVWYILLYVAYSMLVLGHSAWAATISSRMP